jgi:hypothetical protein
MKDFQPIVELKVALQRALIGEVTENLYAVTAGLENNWIKILAYFQGPITEEDTQRIECVGAEVIADFPEGYMIKETSLSLDDVEPECLDFWAFKRATDRRISSPNESKEGV